MLENLWRQTLLAYLDNPLSALFKEKLNVLLSRYCLIPYCMICHSASLRPLGMTAAEILHLLESPTYFDGDSFAGGLLSLADSIPEPDSDPAAPQPGSRYEQALITCATHLFLQTEGADLARSALLRLLRPDLYQNFVAYLAYIQSCHLWVESHPEISYEADQRVKANLPELLSAEPALLSFFQDYQLRFHIQQSARAAALRRAAGERRFLAAFESAAMGVAIISLEGRFIEVNPAFRQLAGYSEEELIGMDFHALVHPEDHSEADLQVGRLTEGEIPSFTIYERYVQKSGAVLYTRGNVSLARDVSGRSVEMMIVVQDVTGQRRDAEIADAANERVGNILGSITDAFCTLDKQWRYTYVNAQAERLLKRPEEELLGGNIWELFPSLIQTPVFAEYHLAVEENTPSVFEVYYEVLDGWYEIHVFPFRDGLSTYFHDITDRKEAERERDQAEREIRVSEERYRLLVEGARDYAMLITDVKGCFTYINSGAERIFGWPESELLGKSVAVIFTKEDQAEDIPEQEMERARVAGTTDNVRWHLREDGTLFWADGTMRSLYDDDGSLRGYAKVVRDATEQKLAQDELEALHALNVTVLESIDDAFYSVDSDWRFTYVNSRAALWLGRTSEQLLGQNLWDLYPASADNNGYAQLQIAMRERQAVTFESQSIVRDVWLEISAFPMPDGLTIYFRDITERRKTQAAQEELLSHEQNIASQLQLALQPEVPKRVPGLAVSNYYKAALDEAEVGGDFYDVFPIANDGTALIVGDLSGKGLAAAAQVAAVRNMLRFALYNSDSVAEAVTKLNRTIEANKLLTGFSTLFVGCYEAGQRRLSYVNCAQEPPLLLRAGNGEPQIEQLLPTGTVLGSFPDSEFEQASVELHPGDTLAIFTDGLTESGPSRRELLDIEGVARLLTEAVAPIDRRDAHADQAAEEICTRLIDKVDAYAGKGMRDDVCLLIAVAKDE